MNLKRKILLHYIKTTFYIRQDLPALGGRSVAKKEKNFLQTWRAEESKNCVVRPI